MLKVNQTSSGTEKRIAKRLSESKTDFLWSNICEIISNSARPPIAPFIKICEGTAKEVTILVIYSPVLRIKLEVSILLY
jgi:hypothetical protein